MKRMLFNATQAEELRVAIVDGQKLIDLDIESAGREQRKSNIYKGVITRIEPSLEAAFVDYGADRHGFLPFKEISRAYFQNNGEPGKISIKEALSEGQELIVQVDKDERGNKGAALTTFISLAGRYLVLMPNNPRGGGVSRRVEGDERAELRELLDQLQVPHGMSLIARTAAIGRSTEELQWDLNYLLQLWKAIDSATSQQKGAFLIYQEGSLVIRAIRDYFQPDIGEILIDTDEIFDQARQFMGHVMPATVNRIKRYRDDVPLFSRFQIEHQIESAYSRQVGLPSGGAIVIDHTEALVSVDVNSGRATRGSDIEETALKTNLEAAEEVARQLRLRDLGGLIVIDFIDMESQRSQREVEQQLRESLRFDRARVQTGKISRFGLMELSRQRLRPALSEDSYIPCPRCSGTGHIRNTESSALHILRVLEEAAMKDNTGAVHAQVPVDVATFLLNEKRQDIQAIELRHKVSILLIPNTHLETPMHSITRLRHEDLNHDEPQQPSYKMVDISDDEVKLPFTQKEKTPPRQEAAIKGITHTEPAPVVEEKTGGNFISKLMAWFGELFTDKEKTQTVKRRKPERKPRDSMQQRENRRNRNNRRGSGHESRERQASTGNREQRDQRQIQARGEKNRDTRKPHQDAQNERKEPTAGNQQEMPQTRKNEHSQGVPKKAAEEGQSSSGRRRRRGARKERPEGSVIPPVAENAATENLPLVSTPETSESRERPIEPAINSGEEKPFPVLDMEPLVSEELSVAVDESVSSASVPVIEETFSIHAEPVHAEPVMSIVNEATDEATQNMMPEVEVDITDAGARRMLTNEIPAESVPAELIPQNRLGAEQLQPDTVAIVEEHVETLVAPDIQKALQGSGLVMVETSHDSFMTKQPETDQPAPTATRVRRRRPIQVIQSNEPLVMVETNKAD